MDVLCGHPNHPESLESLDLRFNEFTSRAIQSVLTIHLKLKLHSLKYIKLRQGIRCVVHRNIRDAILQSLRQNRVVLESIDIFDWDKSVQYLLDINRAGRRTVFGNNDQFPRDLWPLLLERAVVVNTTTCDQHKEEEDAVLFTKSSAPQQQSALLIPRQRIALAPATRRQASVLYHMFRNGGPMMLQQQHHHHRQDHQNGLGIMSK